MPETAEYVTPEYVTPEYVTPERIVKGVMWLDNHAPDWWKRIELDSLDMGMCTSCVLGQLFGDYRDLVTMQGLRNWLSKAIIGHSGKVLRLSDDMATEYGFNATEAEAIKLDYPDAAQWLGELWTAEIQYRRAVHFQRTENY